MNAPAASSRPSPNAAPQPANQIGWCAADSVQSAMGMECSTTPELVGQLQEVYRHLEAATGSSHPHAALAQCRRLVADMIVGLEQSASNSDRTRVEKLLTSREIDVARAVGAGMRNRAIGQDLIISETTVKFHVRNIMRKLGAQNRSEVAALMARVEVRGRQPVTGTRASRAS